VSALQQDPEDGYQPPAVNGRQPGTGDLVVVTDHGPEQRRAGDNPAPSWTDLDDDQRKILTDEFVEWFEGGARLLFLKAGHSICGREGDELAGDAAVKCFGQWPDPRKRALFRESPHYVYATARNLFLDDRKSRYRRLERPSGIPGLTDDTSGIWERPDAVDPGQEVRHAVNALSGDRSELIFLIYWLRMSRVKTAEHLGLTRGQVDRLHRSAIEELRVLLDEEG
jgi:DNA-directed RNA polymerase specialized sigma24 family protein